MFGVVSVLTSQRWEADSCKGFRCFFLFCFLLAKLVVFVWCFRVKEGYFLMCIQPTLITDIWNFRNLCKSFKKYFSMFFSEVDMVDCSFAVFSKLFSGWKDVKEEKKSPAHEPFWDMFYDFRRLFRNKSSWVNALSYIYINIQKMKSVILCFPS